MNQKGHQVIWVQGYTVHGTLFPTCLFSPLSSPYCYWASSIPFSVFQPINDDLNKGICSLKAVIEETSQMCNSTAVLFCFVSQSLRSHTAEMHTEPAHVYLGDESAVKHSSTVRPPLSRSMHSLCGCMREREGWVVGIIKLYFFYFFEIISGGNATNNGIHCLYLTVQTAFSERVPIHKCPGSTFLCC